MDTFWKHEGEERRPSVTLGSRKKMPNPAGLVSDPAGTAPEGDSLRSRKARGTLDRAPPGRERAIKLFKIHTLKSNGVIGWKRKELENL